MTWLKDIEGLKGENLASAMLKLILVRSSDLRRAAIDHIESKSPLGPILMGSHFACHLEQTFWHEDGDESGRGRVDLVIETDDAVIGIENKFYAGFQPGQPQNYVAGLRAREEQLTNLSGASYRSLLVVLAPKSRESQIKKTLESIKEVPAEFVAWEELLQQLSDKSTADAVDSTTRMLLRALKEFYQNKTTFWSSANWVYHLRNSFPKRGTSFQREFCARIWNFFPDAGSHPGLGHEYAGYYFAERDGHLGWYGFMPGARAESSNGAELVIMTTFDISFSGSFKPISVEDQWVWYEIPAKHMWTVNFDDDWNSAGKWEEKMLPITQAVNNLLPHHQPPDNSVTPT